MLSLCFVENVPEELREPFYTDQYDQEHIKPPVVNLLLSAELYCRAGSLILKSDAAKPLLGHDAVIQALAQKGLYVTDQEKLVTERDLHKKPIQMVSVQILCVTSLLPIPTDVSSKMHHYVEVFFSQEFSGIPYWEVFNCFALGFFSCCQLSMQVFFSVLMLESTYLCTWLKCCIFQYSSDNVITLILVLQH